MILGELGDIRYFRIDAGDLSLESENLIRLSFTTSLGPGPGLGDTAWFSPSMVRHVNEKMVGWMISNTGWMGAVDVFDVLSGQYNKFIRDVD